MTTPDPSRAAFERHMLKIGETGLSTVGMGTIARLTSGEYEKVSTQDRWLTWQAAIAHKEAERWQPIETAPRCRTLLLGYLNSHGHWRTLRGGWFSQQEIDETWEDPDGVEPGWFETSVEADDVPNVWRTKPTHWRPLPAAPLPQGE